MRSMHADTSTASRKPVRPASLAVEDSVTDSTMRQTFAQSHEVMAPQWHPTKNGTLTSAQVSRGSDRRIWWLCAKGHEWIDTPSHRVSGRGCPVCSGKRVVAGINDLASGFPDLAAQWHPSKNGTLSPSTVSRKSDKRAWWVCSVGHEWDAKINNRANGTGCPFCAGQRVFGGFNDLATTNPALALQWHPVLNGATTARDTTAFSNKRAWWLCSEGHEWEAHIANRSNGNGCPYCAGQWVLAGFTDMATTHPELALEWHPEKNAPRTPQTVFAGLGSKVWWRDVLGHEWQATGNSRTSGAGCPICSGQRVLEGFNDLGTRDPKLAAEWHPDRNGELKPSLVPVSTARRVWWMCAVGHEWQAIVSSRSMGTGCPVCGGQKVLAGFNDLATRRAELAASWHYSKNGELTAAAVSEYSNKKVWWKCPDHHEWLSTVNNRAHGQGCPVCAEYGFNPSHPGYVYLLEHTAMRALKIGITNVGTSRLASFQQRQWKVVNLELFESGREARSVELAIKRWWRIDLGLSQWLGQVDMPQTGGWSETISARELSVSECINRIKLERRKLLLTGQA